MRAVTEAPFEVASREFIAGLDRTPLGVFAVPVEVLAAVDAHYRCGIEIERGATPTARHYGVFRVSQMLCERAGIDGTVVAAEMLFWWTVSGSIPDDERYAERMEIHRDGVSRLLTVYDNPELYSYFAAGIWDVELIRSLIADGVDAELAGSLAVAAE